MRRFGVCVLCEWLLGFEGLAAKDLNIMDTKTDNRQEFTEAKFPDDLPICDMSCTQWLMTEYGEGNKDVDGVDWLESIGFDADKHIVSKETFDNIKYCEDTAFRCWRLTAYKMPFSDLFQPCEVIGDNWLNVPDERFPIYIGGKQRWFVLTEKAVEIFATVSTIFPRDPAHFSLGVNDNKHLILQYQQIIGHFQLATVIDYPEVDAMYGGRTL